MEFSIKHFTEEDRKAFIEAHELAEPKEWAVMDGSMVWGFFDTKEEAETELREIVRDEKIGKCFNDWEDEVADQFGIDLEVVRQIVKNRIH